MGKRDKNLGCMRCLFAELNHGVNAVSEEVAFNVKDFGSID